MPHRIICSPENQEIVEQAYDLMLSKVSDCIFDLSKENIISSLIDRSFLQESFSFRSLFRARQLARFLIDDEGKLEQKNIQNTIAFLRNKGFICYPNGYSDSVITEHQIAVLEQFTSKEIIRLLYRFSSSICYKAAEIIVFDTLDIPMSTLKSTDVRRAVLCASLTPLRQNIGSCFATAPAILVQQEQLSLFLIDLYQLLSTGQLKRTCGGNEYVVAMSTRHESIRVRQDLHKKKEALISPGILRALTVCGVIDQSLGLIEQIEQMQAICLPLLSSCANVTDLFHKVLKKKSSTDMQQENRRMQAAFTGLCENALLKAWEFTIASFSETNPQLLDWHLYTVLGFGIEEEGGLGSVMYSCLQDHLATYQKEIESLHRESEVTLSQLQTLQNLSYRAPSRVRNLQAEYQSLSHHLQACVDRKNQLIKKSQQLKGLFTKIIQYYLKQFSQYFQEMYDPLLVQQDEDSPAGFRLFYKYGRKDASLWIAIETEEEFNQSLRSFFLATEPLLLSQEREEKIVTEIVSAIVLHLRKNIFFSSAQKRMNSVTPWCYISGGTMQTLVQNYFCRTEAITIENRIVENPLELLIFLIDVLKEAPPVVTDSGKRILMNSPGHAFILLPSETLFRKGWKDSSFTYTWIRDKFIIPNSKIDLLSADMQDYLLQQISPIKRRYQNAQMPKEWRNEVLQMHPLIKAEDVDAFLYRQLPLIPAAFFKKYLQEILAPVATIKTQEIVEQVSQPEKPFISLEQLKRIAKGCLLLSQGSVGFAFDVHSFITNRAFEIGISNRYLMFADTNWPGCYFGFLINPGTEALELWRFDRSGTFGYPMNSWKKWFGSSKKHWSVYVKPFEYRFSLHSYDRSSII